MLLPTIDKIKKRRKELGITQYQLAKESGISAASINQIERGKNKNPSYSTMQKLLDTLSRLEHKSSSALKGKAGEICNKPLIKIKSTDSLAIANKRFDENKSISQLPIFDENNVAVGLLTERSLRTHMMSPDWRTKKVTDAKESIFTVDYNTPIEIVEEYLEQYQCVLVRSLDGRKILGIIIDWDLRRYYRKKARQDSA